MPYLAFNTNVKLSEEQAERLLNALSAATAAGTGKPESIVQVQVSGGQNMYLAGSCDANCYIDFKAIALPEAIVKDLAASLCGVAERELGIPQKRVYISFSSFQGSMWGCNGCTF